MHHGQVGRNYKCFFGGRVCSRWVGEERNKEQLLKFFFTIFTASCPYSCLQCAISLGFNTVYFTKEASCLGTRFVTIVTPLLGQKFASEVYLALDDRIITDE